MPTTAIPMPNTFCQLKGFFSSMYPSASTRHVFRCPKTWYVTGDVFPMTRNVLKFTETDIKQERIMKNCIIKPRP